MAPPLTLTVPRVIAWNSTAPSGTPGAADYVHTPQGKGRFDVPSRTDVLYLADSRQQALGEVFQSYIGRRLLSAGLIRFGSPTAVVDVTITLPDADLLPDLNDPATLAAVGIAPGKLMDRRRAVTQPLAEQLHRHGMPGLASPIAGFRVWSALNGAWLSTVVFLDRMRGSRPVGVLSFGTPSVVSIGDSDLLAVGATLGFAVGP